MKEQYYWKVFDKKIKLKNSLYHGCIHEVNLHTFIVLAYRIILCLYRFKPNGIIAHQVTTIAIYCIFRFWVPSLHYYITILVILPSCRTIVVVALPFPSSFLYCWTLFGFLGEFGLFGHPCKSKACELKPPPLLLHLSPLSPKKAWEWSMMFIPSFSELTYCS